MMDNTNKIIFSGNLLAIWQNEEDDFTLSLPWIDILIPDVYTLYDILQDFRVCVEDIKMDGHLDILSEM